MDELYRALDAVPPGDALFDLDGTLIEHDIGEAALRAVMARGALPEAAVRLLGTDDPWARYLALAPEAQCIAAAQALAGLALPDIEALVDEAFASAAVVPNPAVCELAAAIGVRHRVWILTGSAEVLAEAVAPRLGLRHVRGVRLAPGAGGRLGDAVVGTVSCGEGKVRVAREELGGAPVFAIGDSPWDLPLLRYARHARTTGRIAGVEFPAWPARPARA